MVEKDGDDDEGESDFESNPETYSDAETQMDIGYEPLTQPQDVSPLSSSPPPFSQAQSHSAVRLLTLWSPLPYPSSLTCP